ncbi:hypothetical protein LOD99_13176 [Oopsacas minuta]|uniref:V-type proton ATPase subunit a n=1 Tax=Oopsacas minuta TaxID=111878 RepID=A0AAV7JB41_9METZ|nr:hypothetical protein LOD99_13176 [Oopsacas minuta]
MGSLFRSEEMSLAQLFLQSEAVYACVRELGELGKVQFRDLNPDVSAFQRKFVSEVRRCDEMERKLRFFAKEVKKSGLTLKPAPLDIRAPDPPVMIDLENEFEQLEAQVKDIESHREQLQKNLIDLVELKHVLLNAQVDFEHAERETNIQRHPTDNLQQGLIANGAESEEEVAAGKLSRVNLEFVTGTIGRERFPGFERVLWRATRGNVYVRHAAIPDAVRDPITGNQVFKDVFVLFFSGENLKNRVTKICEGYRATLYPCPENRQERRETLTSIDARIHDLNQVLHETYIHSQEQLGRIGNDLEIWNIQVKKIKAIYHTMNMFNLDVTAKCLIAEGWCPVESMDEIQDALNRGTDYSGASVQSILRPTETKLTAPTYNKTNKFTGGFQVIVDAYGIGNYQEVNPTPYTIITFPFLFAVMFGDAGHGLLMFLFAISLIIFEKRLANWKAGGEVCLITNFMVYPNNILYS